MPSISLSVGCCISIIGLIGVCTRRGALVFLFISLELVLLGLVYSLCVSLGVLRGILVAVVREEGGACCCDSGAARSGTAAAVVAV